MKICTKCTKPKRKSSFTVRNTGKLASWCKKCTALQIELYRKNNPAYSKRKSDLAKKNRAFLRQTVWDYLKAHPCVDCGETDPVVLDFDHRGNKSFNISHATSKRCSLELLNSEISKCDVRCSNCHRRKTAKDRGFYKGVI